MKIYTKTGDKGFTSLTGGSRVKKNDLRVEAYGTIDEANSIIGLAIAKINDDSLIKIKQILIEIQNGLFHAGAEISTPKGEKVYWPLNVNQTDKLEQYIDEIDSSLPPLKQFILPGGTEIGATLHIARAVVRRAERLAVITENEQVITYLNRCSDFLFVAARYVNYQLQKPETSFIPNI